jgi:hypothetical protein
VTVDEREHLLDQLAHAACRDKPITLFFAPNGGTYKAARQLCATCPVLDACRTWTDHHETPRDYWHGLVAGELPKERATRRGVPHR